MTPAPASVPGLGAMTSPDVTARRAGGEHVLLVPLGSTEQHGPHLPLDTDTRIAVAVAQRVADRHAHVSVAPALPYGSSGEHRGFSGTLSIGQAALEAVVVELARSVADTADRLVFVNGHGGNTETVRRAIDLLRDEGHAVEHWSPRLVGGDTHAGRSETSMLLALAPDLVRLDRARAGNTEPLQDLLPTLRAEGVRAVSANGVLGDPTGATAEEGERLLADLADQLDAVVHRVPERAR